MAFVCMNITTLMLPAMSWGILQTEADGKGEPPRAAVTPSPAEPQVVDEPPQVLPRQPDTSDPRPESKGREVVITGTPERGSVVGNIPPEKTLTPLEISTYNATDLGSLIQSLGPQATSLRGGEESAPVVLLNGQRISSFAEIARIPTEAIQRMEVFPEALALAYGFRPTQKVVNVVTFETFSRQNAEFGISTPTEGGRLSTQYAGSLLRIVRDTRLSLDANYNIADTLLESERSLTPIDADPASGDFRSILPRTELFSVNGTVARTFKDDLSFSINGRFSDETNSFLLGVQTLGPVSRKIDNQTLHLGAGFNGRNGRWTWSLTANHDQSDIDIATRMNGSSSPRGQNTLSNKLSNAEVVVNGPIATFAAGRAVVSLRGRAGALDFRGSVTEDQGERPTELHRDNVSLQGSLQIPLASARSGSTWLGNLSANANGAIEELSDVGTLKAYGAGLNWQPNDTFTVFGSYNSQKRAPGIEQLGSPQLITPVLRYFDATSGQTLDIEQVSGGNPSLRPELRREVAVGIYAQPFKVSGLRVSADYIDARITFPIADLSYGRNGLEAIFPDRFTRSPTGDLLRVDVRPVNFSKARQSTLRTGISFTEQLSKSPPVPEGTSYSKVEVFPSEAAMRASLPPGTTVVQSVPGSEGFRQIESMRSRITVALYHTWKLTDEVTPQSGGPAFDTLEGFASDVRGLPRRHQVNLQAGLFRSWFGARLTADWQSRSRVRFQSAASTGTRNDLTSPSYSTLNFNVFANPAEPLGGTGAPPWLRGTRIELGVANLLNNRPRIVDRDGATPTAYQPAYLDPLGRSVSLRLRKIF